MRVRKGDDCPHPPGRPCRCQHPPSHFARPPYQQNLSRSCLRSDQETLVVKLLIWQVFSDGDCALQSALVPFRLVSLFRICHITRSI